MPFSIWQRYRAEHAQGHVKSSKQPFHIKVEHLPAFVHRDATERDLQHHVALSRQRPVYVCEPLRRLRSVHHTELRQSKYNLKR